MANSNTYFIIFNVFIAASFLANEFFDWIILIVFALAYFILFHAHNRRELRNIERDLDREYMKLTALLEKKKKNKKRKNKR